MLRACLVIQKIMKVTMARANSADHGLQALLGLLRQLAGEHEQRDTDGQAEHDGRGDHPATPA